MFSQWLSCPAGGGPSAHICARQLVSMELGGPGHPGHSSCAYSWHCPNAAWGVFAV